MQRYFCAGWVALGCLAAPATWAAGATGVATGETAQAAVRPAVCYVIPVHGMIERGLVYVVRRGMAEAIKHRADAIIFDMDTPGGRLDAAEEIIRILGDSPVRTCTFVHPEAISAGAIIAMATERIYMAPGSRIGDAMPIMVSMFGSVEQMSESIEEKQVSYVAGVMRATAERHGHDPKLAEAMVRRDAGYQIGDEVISAKGRLLTLTNGEAERVVTRDGKTGPLLSLGTVSSLDEVCARLGHPGAQRVELAVSFAERVARWIELFSPFLLIGGLLGIYIEFKTPGFGLPGIAGIVLLGIWFWGHHVAGLAGLGEVLLFISGIALLLTEVFVLPGFGLAGAAGIVLVAVSLLLAMVEHYPGSPWYVPPPGQIQRAVLVLSGALVASFAGMALLARFLPTTRPFRRFELTTSVADPHPTGPREDLTGLRGTADTPLRPAGLGVFGTRRINVVTRGAYISAGRPIVIAETHGNRIVVDELPDR